MSSRRTAQEANAVNNREEQATRFARWTSTRDECWKFISSNLPNDTPLRILVVGAGNGDDLPLENLARQSSLLHLLDFDGAALERAKNRLEKQDLADSVELIVEDVTAGAADKILGSARSFRIIPLRIEFSDDPFGVGEYDLVIVDMIYTQLLHPAMIQHQLTRREQLRMMRTWDAKLRDSLVARSIASCKPGGVMVHIHDLACWSNSHPQPVELDAALADPEQNWMKLKRHDACDPYIALQHLGFTDLHTAWWHWPLEPKKHFLVRATSLINNVN